MQQENAKNDLPFMRLEPSVPFRVIPWQNLDLRLGVTIQFA
jgi:hypothetical protein